jgi:N-acetylglucosaminyl-diphospho-decaprenol L-rhamnosyltransferase
VKSPEVSIVIPAYQSHETIASCLQSLRAQTYRDFETIVVDSSPDARCEQIVRREFPEIQFVHSSKRLLPHAARNRGAARARGRLFVFTDPDVSFDSHWLEALVRSHRKSGGPISGAIDCFGSRWLDSGIHLCKFSKWLPGGSPRPTDCAPTANLLVTRTLYEAIGGFRDEEFLGDLIFSWQARRRGDRLQFEPAAVVFHEHRQRIGSFLRERFERGILFAGVRTRWYESRKRTALFYLTVSVLPIRFPRILALVAGQAWRAGWRLRYLSTFPLFAAGHAASLAGESLGYLRFLLTRRTAEGASANALAPRPASDASRAPLPRLAAPGRGPRGRAPAAPP